MFSQFYFIICNIYIEHWYVYRKQHLDERVSLVVTYHPDLPNLNRILGDHLHILHTPGKIWHTVLNPPLVASQQPHDLNDLVRAVMRSPQPNYEGSSHCGWSHCKFCTYIKSGTSFNSTVIGENFLARVTWNCKTSNIVYLIECQKCKKYIEGKWRSLALVYDWS